MIKRMKIDIQKWNWWTESYVSHVIPSHVKAVTYAEDFEEEIQCASCYKKIKAKDTYTSLEIHTPVYGFGYRVCPLCYREEVARMDVWRKHID